MQRIIRKDDRTPEHVSDVEIVEMYKNRFIGNFLIKIILISLHVYFSAY